MACARGKRVAQRLAGSNPQDPVFHLPIYRAPLEFPNLFNLVRAEAFAPSRRLGQRFLYKWCAMQDERP